MSGSVVGGNSVCRSVGNIRIVGGSNIGSGSDNSNRSLVYQCA